ncbi:MAG: hypothetical protein SPI77_07625 [Corynebacterium sp.]|nr:hypothetical protein [Corynebacterium sp.]
MTDRPNLGKDTASFPAAGSQPGYPTEQPHPTGGQPNYPVGEPYPTQAFPQQGYPGQYPPASYSPQGAAYPYSYPGYEGYPPEPEPHKPKTGLIIGIVLAVLVLAGLITTLLLTGVIPTSSSPSTTWVTETASPGAPGVATGGTRGAVGSGELPSGAVPVGPSGTNLFDNQARGSSVTSEPFAIAVGDEFRNQYRATGAAPNSIRVYSTVTGQWYTMSCTDNGRYARCTGGNNAVVYIY